MIILNDFSTSVRKAFDEIDPDWESYRGLVVCGTHTPHNIEEMIEMIGMARKCNEPFLGICFGFQLAAIEYARNVLGVEDATSEEFGEKGTHVVYKLPQLRVGLIDGESYWHNYAIQTAYLPNWEIALSKEMIPIRAKLIANKFYMGVQYHPEYQSSKDTPHPILFRFLNAAKNAK